jgi:hypothetical protein
LRAQKTTRRKLHWGLDQQLRHEHALQRWLLRSPSRILLCWLHALTSLLSAEDLDDLHDVSVMREAFETIAARKPSFNEKLRDFLKGRNRHGEP